MTSDDDKPVRFPSWANFRELVERGVPVALPISGSPATYLYAMEQGRSIGLRVAADPKDELAPSPLAEVAVTMVKADGEHFTDVSTSNRRLYEAYYGLICAVADRDQIQLRHEPVSTALAASLDTWQELLRPVQLLSAEEQVGLWGELWALERLVATGGTQLVDAWTGPIDGGEPHDLRLGPDEVEVKTSRSRSRVHMFNGLRQLEPSPGHTLHVLSLLIQPAGAIAGHSLPDRVSAVRTALVGNPIRFGAFEDGLRLAGYRDGDSEYYRDRYQLRSAAVLVQVTEDFPVITAATLARLGPAYQRRLREVHYSLDLEGIGDADGTDAFHRLFPPRSPSD